MCPIQARGGAETIERNMTRIALFAALIAALGLIPSLTLAFGVPITAQSMGVMLAGAILGAKRGALAVLLFMALVALGLPLLAGGRGGLRFAGVHRSAGCIVRDSIGPHARVRASASSPSSARSHS